MTTEKCIYPCCVCSTSDAERLRKTAWVGSWRKTRRVSRTLVRGPFSPFCKSHQAARDRIEPMGPVFSSSSPFLIDWFTSPKVENLERKKKEQTCNIQSFLRPLDSGAADSDLQRAFVGSCHTVTTATELIWALDYCCSLKEASLWIPGLWAHSSDSTFDMSVTSFSQ